MTNEEQQFRSVQTVLLQQHQAASLNIGSPSSSSPSPATVGATEGNTGEGTILEQVGDVKKTAAATDDEILIDKAFFGSYFDGESSNSSRTSDEDYYNQWYLHEDGEDFLLTPVLFEDGMNFDECELYYVTQEEDHHDHLESKPRKAVARRSLPTAFRSTLPLRRLEEEDADDLPSCLRTSTRSSSNENAPRPQQQSRRSPTIVMKNQRRRSFGGLPTLPELPEFFRPHSCPDFSIWTSPHLHPKVNFDTDVQVVTVYAASDYPRKIRSNLWLTKKEITRFKSQAKKEKRKRRQKKNQNYSSDDGSSSGSDWSE